jgi:hypothetical protein
MLKVHVQYPASSAGKAIRKLIFTTQKAFKKNCTDYAKIKIKAQITLKLFFSNLLAAGTEQRQIIKALIILLHLGL